MAELSEADSVRRLVDRFGFGAGGESLAALQRVGFYGALVALLAPATPDAGVAATPLPRYQTLQRPARQKDADGTSEATPEDRANRKTYRQQRKAQQVTLTRWWLDRMVLAEHPARERLTWFWHGHFATSVQKVRVAALMLRQNETLRADALGSFTDLARGVVVDPAMLVWLDGNDNTAKAPNENLAREFMELFTLGHGHFTESDVQEAARALTGWRLNKRTGQAVLRPRLHDHGSKTVLGRTGDIGAEELVGVLLDPAGLC